MFGVFPLSPAYGRDYKSKAALLADWIAGKVFKTANGQYCSVRDYPTDSGGITVRYSSSPKVCVLRLSSKGEWRV
jgi:hypothetical protein